MGEPPLRGPAAWGLRRHAPARSTRGPPRTCPARPPDLPAAPLRTCPQPPPGPQLSHLRVLLARRLVFLLLGGLRSLRRLLRGRPRTCRALGLRLHLRVDEDDLEDVARGEGGRGASRVGRPCRARARRGGGSGAAGPRVAGPRAERRLALSSPVHGEGSCLRQPFPSRAACPGDRPRSNPVLPVSGRGGSGGSLCLSPRFLPTPAPGGCQLPGGRHKRGRFLYPSSNAGKLRLGGAEGWDTSLGCPSWPH